MVNAPFARLEDRGSRIRLLALAVQC